MLSRNADTLSAHSGPDEYLMMNVETGRYHGVNAVGARLWELLETPKTFTQLCTQICEDFDVDAETCRSDLSKFVDELIENGIVHKVDV